MIKRPFFKLSRQAMQGKKPLKPAVNRKILAERRAKQKNISETITKLTRFDMRNFRTRKPSIRELKKESVILFDYTPDGKRKAVGKIIDSFKRKGGFQFIIVKTLFVSDLGGQNFRKPAGTQFANPPAQNALLIE